MVKAGSLLTIDLDEAVLDALAVVKHGVSDRLHLLHRRLVEDPELETKKFHFQTFTSYSNIFTFH